MAPTLGKGPSSSAVGHFKDQWVFITQDSFTAVRDEAASSCLHLKSGVTALCATPFSPSLIFISVFSAVFFTLNRAPP